MNGFLLDTNVVSELRKKERCAPKVNAWAATVPRNQDFLSVLVVGDMREKLSRILCEKTYSFKARDKTVKDI